jgi:hypothetical protein
MINVFAIRPPVADLYALIDKVSDFPITNRQLLELASKTKAPKEVKDFYRTFSDNRVFENRDELAATSEQVDILRQEEPEMPAEIERGPEEF